MNDEIKALQEDVCYLYKTIEALQQQIADMQKVEVHYHLTTVYKQIPIGLMEHPPLDEDEDFPL